MKKKKEKVEKGVLERVLEGALLMVFKQFVKKDVKNDFPTSQHKSISLVDVKEKDIIEREKPQRYLEDTETKIEYLESLVTKQLDLYNWCEEKVSTLATIDSVLLGAATIFIDKLISFDGNTCWVRWIINISLAVGILLPLFISMTIALSHIRPKMGNASNSGRPNHRSANGIRHFTKEQYRQVFDEISDEELCEDLSRQIYGMNNNIWKNQKSIKWAVNCDIVGLVVFFLSIIYWIVS